MEEALDLSSDRLLNNNNNNGTHAQSVASMLTAMKGHIPSLNMLEHIITN